MNSSTTSKSNYIDTWVSEPTTRGTWSILWSCTFTIILCVWSALHLNIPHHKVSPRSQFLTKLKWAATAIFAPELVVYCAWQQYYIARKVRDKMRKLMVRQQGKQETSNSTPRSDSTPDKLIDLQYGFYVVMGGFAVDVSSLYDNGDQITLTPFGVVYFAEACGVSAFLISPKEISDKSKADTLAKVLVFFQVSWILLDCMNRWVQNHHLSVLEVHTLAHAACALVMWGFWLSKPLNVGSATLIQPHRSRREAAEESSELIELEHALALVLMQSTMPSRASWLKMKVSESLAGDRYHGYHAFDDRQTESSDLVIYPDNLDDLFIASQNDAPITTVNHQLASLVLDSNRLHHCGRDVMETNVKARIVTGQALCGRIGPWLHVLTHNTRLLHIPNEEQLRTCEERSIPLRSLTEPGREFALVSNQDDAQFFVPCDFAMTTRDIRRWTAAACADAKIYKRSQIMESSPDGMSATEKPEASTAFQCSNTDGPQSDVKVAHEQSAELGGQEVCSHEIDVECPSQTPSSASLRRLSPFLQALPSSEESDAFTGTQGDLFCFCARNFEFTLLKTAMNVWGFQMSDRRKGESLTKYLERIRFPIAGFSALMLLGLISSSYAAIHLSLWNYDFPSEAERYLWRICGCVLASALPVGFVIYCLWFALFVTGFNSKSARSGTRGASRPVRRHRNKRWRRCTT